MSLSRINELINCLSINWKVGEKAASPGEIKESPWSKKRNIIRPILFFLFVIRFFSRVLLVVVIVVVVIVQSVVVVVVIVQSVVVVVVIINVNVVVAIVEVLLSA